MNPAWALLRLASPQLPIGGYSYSQGLEMAVDNGRVQDAASARRWISDQLLLNLARFEAPLLLAHCRAAIEQAQPAVTDLQGHMAVAQVISGAGQLKGIAAGDVQQLFRSGTHPYDASVFCL